MPKSATDRRHFFIVAALVLVSTLVMYWILDSALPLPVQASLEALTIDGLINVHLWGIAFFFSLVVVVMLYSFVAFRKRQDDDSDGVHFEGNTILEIVWTVVPLAIVIGLAYYGIVTLATVTQAGEQLTVKATGFQWAWAFEYQEGFVSPELVLPKDVRVNMQMEARDVLHSFWIPEMRVKQDLVPGQTTNLRFTPTLAGEYKVRCAELCGLSHWSMETPVRVLEQAEYEQWISEQVAAMDGAVAQSEPAPAEEAEETVTNR
jgi:cytochrome c oxidase subunit 2